jgi:hypothetical protein
MTGIPTWPAQVLPNLSQAERFSHAAVYDAVAVRAKRYKVNNRGLPRPVCSRKGADMVKFDVTSSHEPIDTLEIESADFAGELAAPFFPVGLRGLS